MRLPHHNSDSSTKDKSGCIISQVLANCRDTCDVALVWSTNSHCGSWLTDARCSHLFHADVLCACVAPQYSKSDSMIAAVCSHQVLCICRAMVHQPYQHCMLLGKACNMVTMSSNMVGKAKGKGVIARRSCGGGLWPRVWHYSWRTRI